MDNTSREALIGIISTCIHEYITEYLDSALQPVSNGRYTQLDEQDTIRPESYGFAIASYLYIEDSRRYANERAIADEKYKGLLLRCADCLRSETVHPFTKEFILFFSLLSVLELNTTQRERLGDCMEVFRFSRTGCGSLNTNSAVMQYANEVMRRCIDPRGGSAAWLTDKLDFIEESQLPSGFINDGHSDTHGFTDAMPIAYHMFCLWLLLVPLVMDATYADALPDGHKMRITAILDNGLAWLTQATAFDGTVAMAERSMYQIFTAGIQIALCTYEGKLSQAQRLVTYMQRFRLSDGSYSCTPNGLDHHLRIGYETYTRKNDYNNLAFSGLALASRILDIGLYSVPMQVSNPPHCILLTRTAAMLFIARRTPTLRARCAGISTAILAKRPDFIIG